MDTISVTKFDVAERQLLQAIHMFFREDDIISTHTVVEAANQVLSDIGEEYNVKSFLRDSDLIREDKKKLWLRELFKSRNFFKHADRDKDSVHEFKSLFNEFSLIDGVTMYSTIKKTWVPETLVFQVWFSAKYPDLLFDDSEFKKQILCGFEEKRLIAPSDMKTWYEMLTTMRSGAHHFDTVSLEYGL
ncbi:hypothetical protein OS307_002263 [Vibrio parahaemolyticus]|uniref:hypothetical protein n=1 Tax=Vibrio parahaemolyticus TaxID=670 RepID=UPI0004DA8471|nr:hypothetical protein [Vibrio parahaemolyticus]AVW95509.1 hypothetical protein DA442_10485 [Vibrio parahaemolyticus]EGQ8736594.1 hypothetical protein [Vibrio parahaemolyticus]EGQ8904909.1 hypothetical protein [Vibrio parahaemolyticus]EGR3101929.1 hypothetical protein [Vibrio parahaemolyticus]EJC6803501.1 hypothetical protein [Vibrio parahaemolyticus]